MDYAAHQISKENMTFTYDNVSAMASSGKTSAADTQTLPTPPGSTSPALQPQGLTAQFMQLQDARVKATDVDTEMRGTVSSDTQLSVSPDDPAGPITPLLLATHHLPEILLSNGPMAIRYIISHLSASVPGFGDYSAAKARRIIVSALEMHNGSTTDSEVVFEKVGWGCWGARRRGEPRLADRLSPASDAEESTKAGAIGIPINGSSKRRRGKNLSLASTDSVVISNHEDLDMMEVEADRMSLDGSGSASCSEAPDEDIEDDDVTDDEDWAAVGAAALRAESYSTSVNGFGFVSSPNFRPNSCRFSSSFGGGLARTPQYPAAFASSSYAAPSAAVVSRAVAVAGRATTTSHDAPTPLDPQVSAPPVATSSATTVGSPSAFIYAASSATHVDNRHVSFISEASTDEREAVEALMSLSAKPY